MVRLGNTREEPARTAAPTRGSAFPPVAAFGPFRLRVSERVLEKHGIPLKIGSRALDLLVTLVERAPEVVIKRDLISRVWGNLVVDENRVPATSRTSSAGGTPSQRQLLGQPERRPPARA
jgi:DNA-binding response OmpR family regulator